MDQQRVNDRVAEILREHGTQHAQHRAVASRVVTHGQIIDRHESEIGGIAADVASILEEGGRFDQQDHAIAQIATGLAGERQMREGTDQRVGRVERRLDRLDGDFPWLLWGGITAAAFLVNLLFWRFVMYGSNWHPWLEDRGGPEWWQRNEGGVLNAHYWVIVIFFTLLAAAVAVLFVRSNDNDQATNNDGGDDEQAAAATAPVNPTVTAPTTAPEPPPEIDQPTSVFTPSQQVAAQQ